MATKSLSALNAQIQELQQQADALKKQADELRNLERAGVIEELKAKIYEYGLTAGDLRLGSSIKATKRASGSKSAAKAAPKYRSANGEEWSGGRGRKPRWVTEALAAGKALTEFEIK
ncbi:MULTISPECIES: H-NS histone family protein [unclassified Variovorax]|uniref:H-NS histone family protein n=1 Tax=unclassified Variovorax TaxID=663243 RepID=UPI002575ED6B|nr:MULTISPECIES: H-NS histone family protein [unclassified Variovorax]MDM0091662.1 H-NS histone family protein [Variovorax sp. J22G40]MDM0146019.1 H-NS histone family protein [Variovorax sp. J2P1-31]